MKKPLLYPKLAWQGIRKNAETYLPYLLMGILMVGVSYIMNYLTRPALMGALSMGGTTLMVLQMGKIVISVFSVIFLYYCNSFLIRRRMKEFGLYNILGMGKGNIARVMLWETLLTALLVFAGGLLLGLSLSRLVEMALINLLHADYTVPMELFYPDGVTWVLLLFGGIYVLILLANLLRMRLSNPVALLKSENTGEKPPKANWFFGLIGLLILLSAYYVAAVSQSPLEALIFFFIAVLMVIVATYLLLVSGSVTLCRMLRRNKRYYYQTRHFISVSAMAYRMKRNGAGMATICILCTMVLVILTSTVCLYGGTDSMVDAILEAGPWLGHFHVGENNRRPAGSTNRLPWKDMAAALKQVNYQGAIVMEPFVLMGGTIPYDIKVWRDLSGGAGEAGLDEMAGRACRFLKELTA